jgi:hypothetical protein
VEQACAAHGFDVDDFIEQINKYLVQQEEQRNAAPDKPKSE